MDEARRCGFCRKLYSTDVIDGRRAFWPNRSNASGWQPQCVRCDRKLKDASHRRWSLFEKAIEKDGIGDEWRNYALRAGHGTAQSAYLATVFPHGLPRPCVWCHSDPTEWARGHCIDRVSSTSLHLPSNCQVACWPCNRTKSNMHPDLWSILIDGLLARYRRGDVQMNIPWDAYGFQRTQLPDLSDFEVISSQLPLFGCAV